MFVDPPVKAYRAVIANKEIKVERDTRRRPKQEKKKGVTPKNKIDLRV